MFTTDTRKSHCPIVIMYAPHSDSVHSAELAGSPPYAGRNYRPIAVIKGTEFSDYSGTMVERSNYLAIIGDCREGRHRPGIVQIYGSHGYQALAYDATLGPVPADDVLSEMLECLEQHTIIDEDHHSNLESELEAEAWVDHGMGDFKKALVAVLDAFDDDGGADAGHEHELPDDDTTRPDSLDECIDSVAATWGEFWWDLWRAGCDEFDVNGGSGFTSEIGCSVYFYIDEWVKRAQDMERTNPSEARHRMGIAFKRIAAACRLVEGD